MDRLKVTMMLVNGLENPCGTSETIRVSWVLTSRERNQCQTAYRIIVSDCLDAIKQNVGNKWDTGRYESGDSIHIQYSGETLEACRRYWWKVMVWDQNGRASDWSRSGFWDMGIAEFKGKWIAEENLARKVSPLRVTYEYSPYLRKTFAVEGSVTSAKAYICGLGYYELYLNGEKVGDHVLDPAFSRYDKTSYYVAYDVTGMLKPGKNAIGVILGNGFYNSYDQDNWNFKQADWRDTPKLMFQLDCYQNNGEKLEVASDGSWKACQSPNIRNNLMTGEIYDARLEQPGWNLADFDDSGWGYVKQVAPPGGKIVPQEFPPIRIQRTIEAASVSQLDSKTKMADFAENVVGYARIRVKGNAGDEITLSFGERLTEDGYLDVEHISGGTHVPGFQTDKYILKGGDGYEEWQPMFTYHGFRYVQIEGADEIQIKACVLNTDFKTNGGFECSSKLLNKIQSCIIKSTLGNYHSFPADCPHREKNGWSADGHLSAEQMLMNFDSKTALEKWLRDFQDVQRSSGQLPAIVPSSGWFYNWGTGPSWDGALALVTWYIYLYRGDKNVLRENFPYIEKYVHYLRDRANNHIISFGLGDWAHPGSVQKCPPALTDTIYYFTIVELLSKMALILDKTDQAHFYGKMAEDIRDAFRREFIDFDQKIISGDCQTAYACSLYYGMLEPKEYEAFTGRLAEAVGKANRHIDCGILGTKCILQTLSENGCHGVACDIALQTTYPSWGHWIMQGADTLWEKWEGIFSRNHHMYSTIGEWFYKYLAGIRPDLNNPGFKKVIIKPYVDARISRVNAWINTPYGKLSVNWRAQGDDFTLKIEVPVNASAELRLPSKECDYVINGMKQTDYHCDGGRIQLSVGSGSYELSTKIARV